jgi:hypothetical protein
VVRFYNKRGTAEQCIKESKQAVALTRLSCHRFRANAVRLWLSRSPVGFPREAILTRCGAVGTAADSKPGSNFAFAKRLVLMRV